MERMVQCLSPVHIGTGKDLEPFDYIVDGQRYIRVHLDAVLERLTAEQADELAAWVGKQADRIGETNEGQRQRDNIRRETQLVNFPGADAALKAALCNDPALARYHGDRGFERNVRVREQVKEADETACIPGSSLKGALRTALAFVALEEMAQEERKTLSQALEQEVGKAEEAKRRNNKRQLNRLKESIGQKIEEAVFRCGKRQRRGGQVSYADIHYDLLRAVSVSDTYDAQATLVVPQIYTFVEPRNRNGETELDAQAPLIAEAHAPGNTFGLRLRIDAELLRAVSRSRRGDEWIDFEQRVRRAFGPEVARLLPNASKAQLEQAVTARLETAARRFARVVVAAEQRWEEKHGHASTRALHDFYKQLNSQIGKGLVPLRVGWGSHFTDTTLLLVLKEDAGWRRIVERCFLAFDLGLPPRQGQARGPRQIDLDDFPRSRRLVAIDGRPVAPLGWVALAPTVEELPGPLVKKERLLVRAGGSGSGHGGRQPAGRERHGESGLVIRPQTDLKAGDRVEAELLEEKTRKGGWKAKHSASGLAGPIQDSRNAPADAAPGQRVPLTVASVSRKEIAFKWAEPSPPKKKTPRTRQPGPHRRPR